MPIVIALVAHGLGVFGGFVADDVPDIVTHPVVSGDAGLASLFEYNYMGDRLGEGPGTLRPLATLHFAVEWKLFGNRPALFHLMSIAWFVALVIISVSMLRRLMGEWAAICGGALFAAMAIHVDAVGLVANRPEVCSLTFALLALGAAIDRKVWRAAGFYLVALLFKESAFLLPLVAAWWLLASEGIESLKWRAAGRALVALLVMAALFFAGRSLLLTTDISGTILKADNPLLGEGVAVRLWMPLVLLGEYLQVAAVPTELAFDYTYAAIPVDADVTRHAGWLGLAAVALVVGVCASRTRSGLAVALGCFAISYALFSNSVFLIVTLFAERLFLAPSFFLVAALGCAGEWSAGALSTPSRRIAAIALVALLAIQTALAAQRTAETFDQQSLLVAQIANQPDSVKGHLYYARVLDGVGAHREAVWHLAIATLGRKQFPAPFRAPSSAGPIEERLASLPGRLAPDRPPAEFWKSFRAFVAERLSTAAAATLGQP